MDAYDDPVSSVCELHEGGTNTISEYWYRYLNCEDAD